MCFNFLYFKFFILPNCILYLYWVDDGDGDDDGDDGDGSDDGGDSVPSLGCSRRPEAMNDFVQLMIATTFCSSDQIIS